MNKIVMVTSIVPRNLSIQKKAITSWVENGFQVISCNSKSEILQIHDAFPQVEFVEVDRDASEVIGKPCPYIYDMLQILRDRMDRVGGIFNSDIHLLNFDSGMYDYLIREAQDKVLFMRRHDVDDIQNALLLHSAMYLGGIDVFLFYKEAINRVPDDGLILGQVMWDYWMPIILKLKGINVKEVINPIAFHVRHPVQWGAETTDIIASRLCRKYFPYISVENATYYLKNLFMELMSDTNLQICYVTEDIKESKIIVKSIDTECKFDDQTHNGLIIMKRDAHMFLDYDYLVEIPYHIIPSCSMIDLAIWVLNQYKWDSLQLSVYWRGNVSRNLKIENCNQRMVEKFNTDIIPIRVSRFWPDNEKENRKICYIYTCSVYVEEDIDKIWKEQQIGGRIYLYPAGFVAQMWVRRFIEQIKEIEILGFVDQSIEMQKKTVCGYPVYSPDILKNLEIYDKVLVISNMYSDEIYDSLLKRKVPAEKILIWNEFDGIKWKKDSEEIWSKILC